MENDVVKLISIVLIIILLLLVMFLKYKENKKGKYATKCPSYKSKNIIHEKPIFIKTVKRHIPETKDLRTLSGNPILDAMDTKCFTIEKNFLMLNINV